MIDEKQLKLKVKLKLKYLRKQMECLAGENFGYYPNSAEANDCILESDRYLTMARDKFPDIYQEYINCAQEDCQR